MLDGDLASGRVLLCPFINATIGSPALAEALGMSAKSLMRGFGPEGNPTAGNLLAVIQTLKFECSLSLTVHVKRTRSRTAQDKRAA